MTSEKLSEVTNMIRGGVDYHTACAAAELSDAEANAGLKDQKVIAAVRVAYAQCKVILIRKIQDEGSAKGAIYLWERLFPDSGDKNQSPKRITHEPAADDSDDYFDPLIESTSDIPL